MIVHRERGIGQGVEVCTSHSTRCIFFATFDLEMLLLLWDDDWL